MVPGKGTCFPCAKTSVGFAEARLKIRGRICPIVDNRAIGELTLLKLSRVDEEQRDVPLNPCSIALHFRDEVVPIVLCILDREGIAALLRTVLARLVLVVGTYNTCTLKKRRNLQEE